MDPIFSRELVFFDFIGHLPEWTEDRIGFNAILDLGTFLGDTIIERNAGFAWEIFVGIPASRQRDDLDFQSIKIRSPQKPDRGRIDPVLDVSGACSFLRNRIEPRGPGVPRPSRDLDAIYRRTASLIVATARDVVARPDQSFAYLKSDRQGASIPLGSKA